MWPSFRNDVLISAALSSRAKKFGEFLAAMSCLTAWVGWLEMTQPKQIQKSDYFERDLRAHKRSANGAAGD